MNVDSIAADVAAAAASLAGGAPDPASVADTTPASGEKTAEALHGRSPEESGEHDQGKGRGRDEMGRYTPKAKAADKVELVDPAKKAEAPAKATEKVPAKTPDAPQKPDPAKAPEPAEKAAPEKPAEKAPEAPALQAPRNWRPVAREEWAKLPRAVQEEAIRVDREAQVALSKSAKEREYAASVRQAIQPYEHMLRAEGLDAPRAIGDLLKTAALLRTGTPAQKEAWAADAINRFNIDVEGINRVLNGPGAQVQPGQPAAPQAAPAQHHDPRIDQLIAQQQQFLAQQQAAAKAAAERQRAEMEDFGAKAEFFDDVVGKDVDGNDIRIRDEMADEILKAARRGKNLTLDQAHARVLATHKEDPDSEIGKVLRQRAEAAAAKAQVAQSQQAKAAATVSVKAEPAPVAVPASRGTPLDDVMAAYARLTQ